MRPSQMRIILVAPFRLAWAALRQLFYCTAKGIAEGIHWAKHYAKGEWLRVKREWQAESLRGPK